MLYFIHGLNGYPSEWNSFIDIFTSYGYSCQAVDLQKGMKLKNTRFSDYIKKISSMVQKDDILIGHSMGGLIVQKVAEQKRIKAGVCLCPAAPQGIMINRLSILSQLRYIPNILAKIPFKPSFNIAYNIFLNNLSRDEAKKSYERMQKQSAIVTYEVFRSKIPVDETKITCPLFFIARKNDKIIPLSAVKKIAEKYQASLKIYEGNHYIYPDAGQLSEEIYHFIKSVK